MKLIAERSHLAENNDCIEELTRQNKRLTIINRIAQSINVEMSYDEIIHQVAGPLKKVLPYDLLSFCLIENNQLIIKSGIPKEQKILGEGWVLHAENSAPWKAIHDKHCFLRQDIPNDPHQYQEDEDLLSLPIRSAIMAPLLVNNEVIGALNFGSKNTYAYREQDFLFVQQLADQLAVCLKNTQLFNQISRIKADWEQTFQAVPDQLFLMDQNYTVLRHNQHPEISASPQRPKCYQICYRCHGYLQLCPVGEAFIQGESITKELISADQQKIYLVSAYPVRTGQEKVSNMVLYIQDITEKRLLEYKLFESAKMASIGELAAGVAHELNSTLTAIIGNSDLLLRKPLSEDKSTKLLTDIRNCGQRSKKIIQNLLTFSRQDNVALETVLINDVVKNSLSLISYQIEKNNITIQENYLRNIPPLLGNKLQLEQVVINFLLNARDALQKSENGTITVSTTLTDDIKTRTTWAVVTVEDNGEGISKKNLNKIFQPFFTLRAQTGGTGLGLPLSLGIAQTHGGRIEVWSELGKGSKFSLMLPL
ncbi:GAF domain-containing sensor histidine kinase [Dehalobacterium formicoaceticum]|uniref:GAF domain-containing sensor histidine kinase n=2 Tax=Dehalobacterium formicoaceticum TaxID=51515 RepID=UPI0031F6F64A